SSSLLVMRSMSLLLVRSPGTMAKSPDLAALKASSLRSNRSLALRSFSSGPWHLKQLSERMGRISRLKSTRAAAPGLSLPTARKGIPRSTAVLKVALEKPQSLNRIGCFLESILQRDDKVSIRHRKIDEEIAEII